MTATYEPTDQPSARTASDNRHVYVVRMYMVCMETFVHNSVQSYSADTCVKEKAFNPVLLLRRDGNGQLSSARQSVAGAIGTQCMSVNQRTSDPQLKVCQT